MTDNDSIFFTDEDIYRELEKLGITHVSPEIFEKMRQDLIDMVSSGISDMDNSHCDTKNSNISDTANLSVNSLKRGLFQDYCPNENSFLKSYDVDLRRSASKNFRYTSKSSHIYSSSSSTNNFLSSTPNLPFIYESNEKYITDPEMKRNREFFSYEEKLNSKFMPIEEDRLETSYRSLASHEGSYLPRLGGHSQTNESSYIKAPFPEPGNERFPDFPSSDSISSEIDRLKIRSPKPQSLLGDYRKRLVNYKTGNKLRQEISTEGGSSPKNEQSTIIDGKLKRKILRYKDGKPVVVEELVDIPNIYSSCYPSSFTITNSVSSDLSFKSNSSTGSLVVESPESTPRSILSNLSKTSAFKPHRKKKSDPVAMYNYYKKFWDNFKPPGEKTHQKLRWAVRDKMLDYSL